MLNNGILKPLGLDPVMWYSEQKYWPFILCFVNLWEGVGYGCLIYIAGIAGIDKTYYEAARLDGASRWQQIRRITLPCLVPSIITLLLLNIGRIFIQILAYFIRFRKFRGII